MPWRLGWLQKAGISRLGDSGVWLLALGGMLVWAEARYAKQRSTEPLSMEAIEGNDALEHMLGSRGYGKETRHILHRGKPLAHAAGAVLPGRGRRLLHGWVDAENNLAELEPVGTVPAYRKQGLGKALLAEVSNRLRSLGCRTVTVSS